MQTQALDLDSFRRKIFDYEENDQWKFAGGRPAIVDFYADWCGPCRAQAPVLEQIAQEYDGKVDVFKIDTEAHPELAQLFGVRGIPSLLFIPMNGDPAMQTGMMSVGALRDAISDLFQIAAVG